MFDILEKYIPKNAMEEVKKLLYQHPIAIKIVNNRLTKHGDFKRNGRGKFQITVNNNLNKYHFLLTLIHEIAHFITFKEHKYAKPHGMEWKMNFQRAMLPLLKPAIFPQELLPYLANYLINPKASTGSDVNLTYALKKYDKQTDEKVVFELPFGSFFSFKNKTYQKGYIRRTRIECRQMENNKIYLFNQNAAVSPIASLKK